MRSESKGKAKTKHSTKEESSGRIQPSAATTTATVRALKVDEKQVDRATRSITSSSLWKRGKTGTDGCRVKGKVKGQEATNRAVREEMERIQLAYDRQKEEIVALRALVKSIQQESITLGPSQSRHPLLQRDTYHLSEEHGALVANNNISNNAKRGGEFFRIECQLLKVQQECDHTKAQLKQMSDKCERLQQLVATDLPRQRLLTIKYQTELEGTRLQLEEERNENEKLRRQVAFYKARSHEPIRIMDLMLIEPQQQQQLAFDC